jgi:hypothetical protein
MHSPGDLKFRGSKVLEHDDQHFALWSWHTFTVENVPFRLDRYLFFTANTTYVTLVTKIRNVGHAPVSLRYAYGDEPWLGNFGSSRGNVGWLDNEIVLTERNIDTQHNQFAGMFDCGNELIGEGHDFTGKANFIEWEHANPPNKAFFSNIMGGITNFQRPIPLSSATSRFLGLVWGPITISPQESFTFTLAVGMAGNDPVTGFPAKPATGMNGK